MTVRRPRMGTRINEWKTRGSSIREIFVDGSLAVASTPQEKSALERQIQVTDERIDRLVYELYGLTEKEIEIVEG